MCNMTYFFYFNPVVQSLFFSRFNQKLTFFGGMIVLQSDMDAMDSY